MYNWSTAGVLNVGTPPLIEVATAVSASSFKNDTAGIKYVEYNDTIEQMQEILNWWYSSSNKVTAAVKVQILRMRQLNYKYVEYSDTVMQMAVNSELLEHLL